MVWIQSLLFVCQVDRYQLNNLQLNRMIVQTNKNTSTQEDFYISGKKCSIGSKCFIDQINPSNAHKSAVTSFFSYGEQNHIRKAFRIVIDQRIITFQDVISICSTSSPSSLDLPPPQQPSPLKGSNVQQNPEDNNRNKKLVLFKDNLLSGTEDRAKGDKKNIVKNVVNAFIKYLKRFEGQGKGVQNPLRILGVLIKERRFNNQLITSLVKEEAIRPYFKVFLSAEAGQWLQQSKIRNKRSYSDALAIYEGLCNKEEGSEEGSRPSGSGNEKDSVGPHKKSSDNSLSCFRELGNNELQQQIMRFK